MAQKFRNLGIGELRIKTLALIPEFLNSQSLNSGLSGLGSACKIQVSDALRHARDLVNCPGLE